MQVMLHINSGMHICLQTFDALPSGAHHVLRACMSWGCKAACCAEHERLVSLLYSVFENVHPHGRADTALADASAVLRGLSETPASRPPPAPDATAYGATAATPPAHATQGPALSESAGGPAEELTASAESEAAFAALLASAASRSERGGAPADPAGFGLKAPHPGPHAAAAMAGAASKHAGHAGAGPRNNAGPGSELASADLLALPAELPRGAGSAASAGGSGSEAAWEDLLLSPAPARASRDTDAVHPGLHAAGSGSEAAFSELLASPAVAWRGGSPGAAGPGASDAGAGAEAASPELLGSPASPRHRGRADASAAKASGSEAEFAELLAPRGPAGAASSNESETHIGAFSCGSPVDVAGSSMAAAGRGAQTLHEDLAFRGNADAFERGRRQSGAAQVVQQPDAPAAPQPPVVVLATAAQPSGGAHMQRAHGDAPDGRREPDVRGGLAAAHGKDCQAAHGAAAAAFGRQEEAKVPQAWEQAPLAAAAAELLAAVRTAPGLQPTPAHTGAPQARPGATRGPAQRNPSPDVQLAADPVHDMEGHGWDEQQQRVDGQSRGSADAAVPLGFSAQWPAAAQAAAQTPDQVARAAETLPASPGAQGSAAADPVAINVPLLMGLAAGAAETLSEPALAGAPPAAGAVPADQAAGAAETLAGFSGAAAAAGSAALAADLADGAALAARFAAGSRRMQAEMAALRASLEGLGVGGGPQRGPHIRSLLDAPAEAPLRTATASASASPELDTCAEAAPTAEPGRDVRTPGGTAVPGAQHEPEPSGVPHGSGAAPAPSANDGSLAAFLSGADGPSQHSRAPAQPHAASKETLHRLADAAVPVRMYCLKQRCRPTLCLSVRI